MKESNMFVFFAALLMLAFGCSNPNYQSEITELDKFISDVEIAKNEFESLNSDDAVIMLQDMKDGMRKLKMTAPLQVSKEDSEILGNISDAKRLIKDLGANVEKLTEAFDKTPQQLEGLKNALSSGATIDAKGNKINPSYVNKHMIEERAMAEKLLYEEEEFASRLKRSREKYEATKGKMDSLILAWKEL